MFDFSLKCDLSLLTIFSYPQMNPVFMTLGEQLVKEEQKMPHGVLDEAVGSLANRLQQIVFSANGSISISHPT